MDDITLGVDAPEQDNLMSDLMWGNPGPNWRVAQEAEVAGHILGLLGQVPEYQRAPIANLTLWLLPPVALHQARVFFDDEGNPVAYVTWAKLAKGVSEAFKVNAARPIDSTEWNEGEHLWITDFVSKPGAFSRVKRWIKEELVKRHGMAHWHRAPKRGRADRWFQHGRTVRE